MFEMNDGMMIDINALYTSTKGINNPVCKFSKLNKSFFSEFSSSTCEELLIDKRMKKKFQ